MTTIGFWDVFALSRYTSGLPRTVCRRIGKSARTLATSSAALSCAGAAGRSACKVVAVLLMSVVRLFAPQPRQQRGFQPLTYRCYRYPVQQVARESVDQDAARFASANAA